MSHRTMRSPKVALLAVCLSWACINVPEVEQVPEHPDASAPDAHVEDAGIRPDASVSDAGIPDSGSPDSGTPDLTLTLVTSRAITNSDVQIRATVTGAAPDEVELLVDGVAVATLFPPYELRWNAQSLEEGPHELSARVTLGGRTFVSEARTLVVDRTKPRIVSRIPLTGARTVSVHQTIRATFSEPLDPSTVHAESVRVLSDAGIVVADVVLAPGGTALNIQPASLLPPDVTLRVTLDSSVVDLAGNAIQALPQDWEWTVPGYLPVGEPLSASPAERPVTWSPALQIDGTGQPVVAWLDGTALEPYDVRVKRWNGSDWELLGGVLEASTGNYTHSFCSLAVDGGGRPIVAWDEISTSGAPSLRVRRWSGSTWDAMGAPVVPLLPQASVDTIVFRGNKQGQLALAFREVNQSAEQVAVWRWNGSGWGALGGALKVNPAWGISAVRMAIDAAGNPTVAWSEQTTSGNRAVYMRRWNGSTWEAIPMPTQEQPGVLVVDDLGAPVMDMPEWNGATRSARLWRWNGNSWMALGSPFSLYPGTTDSVGASLALDAQGRLSVLIAESEGAGMPSVYYVRRWIGGAWEPVGSLYRNSPGLNPVGPVLFAMDSAAQPVLAQAKHPEGDPDTRRVHVYRPNN